MERISLLYPAGLPPAGYLTLDETVIRDLGLTNLLTALSDSGYDHIALGRILFTLCSDPAVIHYRQDIFADVWHNPPLFDKLSELLPKIKDLDSYRSAVDRNRSPLQEMTWRLGELESFVECINGLQQVFSQGTVQLKAQGWLSLKNYVAEVAQEAQFKQLQKELPDMLSKIRAKTSVTIGVNLDAKLRPVGATLVSINEQKFISSSWFNRLLGQAENGLKGIGPLHTMAELDLGEAGGRESKDHDISPLMVPLFRDLAKLLDKVTQPLAKALARYVNFNTSFLAALSQDLLFYLAAVRLCRQLQERGWPVTRPEIAPLTERVCVLKEAYNLNLALHFMRMNISTPLIFNEVEMGEKGRIFILTGPNQGGKTTYTQMVGLCHILAQAGCWVPAGQARLSPVDYIYTHYPIEEQLERATGRFGDEAQRLGEIFGRVTPHSLVLLNESLSSTSPGESVYLAQDLVRIMRRLGVRAIYGTHLHELAAGVEQLNHSVAGSSLVASLVISLVDQHQTGHRSFKVVFGPPQGQSFAREIAAQYGISYDQLNQLLQQRGFFEGQ